MTSEPFQGRTFQTAVRRRLGKPLVLRLEHMTQPEVGEPQPIDVDLRFDPMIDTVRLGAAFGDFGALLKSFSDDTIAADIKTAKLTDAMPKVRGSLRECVVPQDRGKYDEVQDLFTVSLIAEVIQWLTQELSGLDPTRVASSSDGLVPTSQPLTGTPPPEA